MSLNQLFLTSTIKNYAYKLIFKNHRSQYIARQNILIFLKPAKYKPDLQSLLYGTYRNDE